MTLQPASVLRHGQLRLAELTTRAGSLCARNSATGRVELSDPSSLKQLQALLRDAEWVLFVVADAMVELGASHALEGLTVYTRRKLGPVHAAAIRAAFSAPPPAQPLQASAPPHDSTTPLSPFRGVWAPWLDGVRLQSAGKFEEAERELRRCLEPSSAAINAEPAQVSYVSTHISQCHAELCAAAVSNAVICIDAVVLALGH